MPAFRLGSARRETARVCLALQFVRGLLFIGGSLQGEGFTGYMLGRKIRLGAALLPAHLGNQVPHPQLLTAAGLAALVIRIRRQSGHHADLFVWGTAFFLVTAVLSNFRIGFRHVLRPASADSRRLRWNAGAHIAAFARRCAFARLARGLLAARLPSWRFLFQRVGRRARARLEIPGRQQSRLGGSTRPGAYLERNRIPREPSSSGTTTRSTTSSPAAWTRRRCLHR